MYRRIALYFSLLFILLFLLSACSEPSAANNSSADNNKVENNSSTNNSNAENNNAATENSDTPDPEGPTYSCADDLITCDTECVDTRFNISHCGDCDTVCDDGLVCHEGECVAQVGSCPEETCLGMTYCDAFNTPYECKDGCSDDPQCSGMELCNNFVCECMDDYHHCNGTCVSNHSVDSCGDRCTPCPTSSGTLTLCENEQCIQQYLFKEVASGSNYICGILVDNSFQCWGTFEAQSDAEYLKFSLSPSHVCALDSENKVSCWGNLPGELPAGTYSDISVNGTFSCGITTDGEIACVGQNYAGQLNAPSGTNYKAIAAGREHACALTTDGEVECWGSNETQQLDVPEGAYKTIVAGDLHICALSESDEIICWGANFDGQTNAPSGQFASITAGGWHNCALTADNDVHCWGSNGQQQAGQQNQKFSAIMAGYMNTCGVLMESNTGICWGDTREVPTIVEVVEE